MTIRTLRRWSLNSGRVAILFGAVTFVVGLCVANPHVTGAGCLAAFTGAYALLFGQLGSF